jgi:AraC-like DNA-binding protein
MAYSRPPSARNVAKIKRILTTLDGHVGQGHELDELAAIAGLSRSYFSKIFHAVAGMSLRDYLRAVKLKRAIELVRSSTRSLTDIAVESGFYDLAHLDKAFRQRFGTSPYNFRARHTERSNKMQASKARTTSTFRQPPSASRRVPGIPGTRGRDVERAPSSVYTFCAHGTPGNQFAFDPSP